MSEVHCTLSPWSSKNLKSSEEESEKMRGWAWFVVCWPLNSFGTVSHALLDHRWHSLWCWETSVVVYDVIKVLVINNHSRRPPDLSEFRGTLYSPWRGVSLRLSVIVRDYGTGLQCTWRWHKIGHSCHSVHVFFLYFGRCTHKRRPRVCGWLSASAKSTILW